MKCLFIVNPVSGTKSLQNNLKKFQSSILDNTSYDKIDTFYTKKRYDATNKVKSLKSDDYDLIVAVGGDGTVNEVVSGLAESQSQIPMTLIPAGTVNDFASYLQIPTDPLGFSQMIAQNNIQDVDLGKVGDHYFINVLAGGMFADIAFQVTKEEKNILGPLAYYLTGLREFNNEINMEMHLKIEADGKTFEED
ncbi:MAG: YegS/Rv2252/BmrU family lipid kinase, partial [Erysipelotrichaceae bacterium]|nr:YegS/Rv2252/BmrU family lipid kinase [Erysipelotrichaceae bacterium]